jgi:hypothetical protein
MVHLLIAIKFSITSNKCCQCKQVIHIYNTASQVLFDIVNIIGDGYTVCCL